MIERLVSCGSRLDVGDTQDYTPIMHAAHLGHTDAIQRLCLAGLVCLLWFPGLVKFLEWLVARWATNIKSLVAPNAYR